MSSTLRARLRPARGEVRPLRRTRALLPLAAVGALTAAFAPAASAAPRSAGTVTLADAVISGLSHQHALGAAGSSWPIGQSSSWE